MDIYIVKGGDTVTEIAKRCGTTPRRLAADNGLFPDTPLAKGQALTVRQVRTFHTVRRDETLRDIAVRYGVSVKAVYRMNPTLCGLPRIRAGQPLAVQMADAPKKRIQVLGVPSPCPKPLSLPAVLPFLTYISPYTCHIAKNSGLHIPDTALAFETARDYGVLPLLRIDGTPTAVNRFTETVVYAIAVCGAAGVVTDTALPALATRLAAANALYLQAFPALFHHGCDCQSIKPPAYLSAEEAVALAVRCGAKIRFDATENRPYFCYRDSENRIHTVWFYDARSWCAQTRQTCGITVQNAEKAIPVCTVLSALYHIVE